LLFSFFFNLNTLLLKKKIAGAKFLAGLWPASQSLEDGRNLLFLTFSCLQIISLGVIQITVRVNIKTDRVIIYPVGFLNPQVNMNFSDGYTFFLPVFFKPSKKFI
jgi:hypothetical protein